MLGGNFNPSRADRAENVPRVMRSVSGIYGVKTMSEKLLYIPYDDTQNYPLCRLQLVVGTFEHST